MLKKFKLRGNMSGAIRSDEEMKAVNKVEADNAFKTQKKKLDHYLLEKGFFKYKTNVYIRKNKLDVLEYIDLQKERYGSKTFTVNYALIPLYVPHDFLSFDLGDRLGMLICKKDVWWDYAEDNIASISFQNVADAIEEFLLPWFERISNGDGIKEALLKEKKKREKYGGQLSDIQQVWLDAIDSHTDSDEIIRENIKVFKLPSKMLG